jgi:hypothetical protein
MLFGVTSMLSMILHHFNNVKKHVNIKCAVVSTPYSISIIHVIIRLDQKWYAAMHNFRQLQNMLHANMSNILPIVPWLSLFNLSVFERDM